MGAGEFMGLVGLEASYRQHLARVLLALTQTGGGVRGLWEGR